MNAWRRRGLGARWLLALCLGAIWLGAATPTPPTVFRTARGQFEVSATNATTAQGVTAAAAEAWRTLSGPLGLPSEFSEPIFVRLVSSSEWREAAAFRAIVEPGGVVSVRVPLGRADPLGEGRVIRRALVQALLLRVAVARQGVSERVTCPLWLELACVGWWETHVDPAQLDRLKAEARELVPPRTAELLSWQRGAGEPAAWRIGAVWWLSFLQSESTRANEWPEFLAQLLAGAEPLSALAACFPGRFASDAERELWWSTGFHHLRRVHSLPVLGGAESRGELEALARFAMSDGADEAHDFLVPLPRVLEHAREPFVTAELQRRRLELHRLLPALHPFFRNAGISLEDVFAADKAGTKREAALAAFNRDWADALELAAATTAALDRLERTELGSRAAR